MSQDKGIWITVRYRSGLEVEFLVQEFRVEFDGEKITSAHWKTHEKSPIAPIYMGVSQIESVWEKVKA